MTGASVFGLRRRVGAWVACWFALSALLGALPSSAQIQFTEVRLEAGLGSLLYDSSTFHSLGVNWLDFDNDGWVDLFAVAGGPDRPPHLFRNLGDGTFAAADELLPTLPNVEMSGSRFADFDRDGDLDIFIYTDHPTFFTMVENAPDGPADLLLVNQWSENGGQLPLEGPLFVEGAAAAGLVDEVVPPFGDLPCFRSKTAAWVDYDRDGCIDLYVGHLSMNGGGSAPNRDTLFRNRCDGTFENVTAAAGIADGSAPEKLRGSLAFMAAHFDDDLWPDLYVVHAAGGEEQPYINDFLYRNQGDGTFVEVLDPLPGPGDDSESGMGLDVADVDLDGHWDVYISDLLDTVHDGLPRGNVLYLGQADGALSDNMAAEARVAGHNSWGVAFLDVDHDGDEDLHVATTSSALQEIFYRNNINSGNHRFTNIGGNIGLDSGNSRGSAVADYDHDGDLDLAVVDQNGPLHLFRNDSNTSGRHWIQIRLQGTTSNRDAIGAVVKLQAGSLEMMRQVTGGASAHSQHDLMVHFGLSTHIEAESIEVLWPSGCSSRLSGVAADQILTIQEDGMFCSGFEEGGFAGWDDVVP